jgi:hypothetical protein
MLARKKLVRGSDGTISRRSLRSYQELANMKELTWFKLDSRDYKVGIDTSLDPQCIADCLSAGLDIPLGTKAEFINNKMFVHTYKFTQVSRPDEWYKYDRIFENAGIH